MQVVLLAFSPHYGVEVVPLDLALDRWIGHPIEWLPSGVTAGLDPQRCLGSQAVAVVATL